MSSGDRRLTPPERIQWEIDRFDDAQLPVEDSLDEGLWTLRFERQYQQQPHEFRAVFPVDHPEVAPMIFGPPGLLIRHQDPTSGFLCLVDNEANWWRTWRSAIELVERLDTLLRADEQGQLAVAAGEAPLPEPVTGHLVYREQRTILVPDALLGDELAATAGTFRLRRLDDRLHVVTALFDEDNKLVAEAEPAVMRLSKDDGPIAGWVELAEAPAPKDLVQTLKDASHRAQLVRGRPKGSGRAKRVRAKEHQPRVTGVTFFEEGPGQGERRRTWVFAEAVPRLGGGVDWIEDRPIRAMAISDRQRHDRIPELIGLGDVRVVMVGAGSLGSLIAVELVKAGIGRLDIFDSDVYEPGNSVRHVLPVTAAGRPKAFALQELCEGLNPFCDVHGYMNAVGQRTGDPEAVQEIINDADVIVETTGSHSVTRLLRRRAAATGASVITAALSIGGFGGRSVVLRAGGPCWDCFLLAQEAGDLPSPDEGPRNDRTPFGCSHPAASCAGFEVTHLAAVAARMTVQATLRSAYPSPNHDWTVLNFRPGSTPVQQGLLLPNPDCPRPTH